MSSSYCVDGTEPVPPICHIERSRDISEHSLRHWYKVSIVEFDRCSDGGTTSVASHITWTGQRPVPPFCRFERYQAFDQ